MSMLIRQSRMMKRVTDPLDEKVRAQLMMSDGGYVSSGSDHDGALCLSGLVNNFLINEEEERYSSGDRSNSINHDCSSIGVCSDCDHQDAAAILNSLLEDFKHKDSFRLKLLEDVFDAMESIRDNNRRAVARRLREIGYNAGVCKAKWETSGGLAAGSYEYIDVVAKEERYIIDLCFASEFEIARATEDYLKVAAELPAVMVGTVDEVKQVVRVLGDAARRSLRRAGMHVPPWRKTRYMLSKWLGPYKRTTNPVPSTVSETAANNIGGEIKCRAIGFNASAITIIRPAARTR